MTESVCCWSYYRLTTQASEGLLIEDSLRTAYIAGQRHLILGNGEASGASRVGNAFIV